VTYRTAALPLEASPTLIVAHRKLTLGLFTILVLKYANLHVMALID